jgi:hypothetical protein
VQHLHKARSLRPLGHQRRAEVSAFKVTSQTGHASDAMLARYVRNGELFPRQRRRGAAVTPKKEERLSAKMCNRAGRGAEAARLAYSAGEFREAAPRVQATPV